MLVLCSGCTAEGAQMFDFDFLQVKGPNLRELESSSTRIAILACIVTNHVLADGHKNRSSRAKPMLSLMGVKNEALIAIRLGVNYMDLYDVAYR